ncbi:fibronectin type III domain-containing protein [Qipengyuania huizhouensis]|uniref:fibronectin type III domain-containing protein n=1 Tax=Qipengyuania huizhouensis TaxID=2867245 RepID=UPI001C86E410|nr:fibronectin type III domain-containing protein [Qipengyuania huizhouensis]MBX7459563.1 fibronectin type III domain-containing protein [Qipengyuania huizhouensis]
MAKAVRSVGRVVGAIASIAAMIPGPHQPIAALVAVGAQVATMGAQALIKPPPARGSVSQILIQPDAPQPYIMGEGYFAGVLRHDTGYGATLDDVPNPYRGMVVVYSGGGPIESITPQVDFAAVSSWYDGFLYTDTQLGACPEPGALTPNFSGMPGWGASAKLSGQAAILYNLKFDKDGKRFASGVPLLGAYGQWVKVYDPRLDDTQPGGVGAHRLGDETTYEYSANPALHAGTYAYGRYQNGKRTIGMGLPADGIDWATVAAWANVCDANGWTIFLPVFEPGDRWANLKDICFAGGAEPVAGGKLTFKYSAPVVALDTITADDLTDDNRSITGMQPFRDRINTVIPKYRSPNHNWEMVDAEPVVNATFLTEDGEEKREVWPFNGVKNATQASQLAAYRMRDSRELPFTVTCKPHMRFYRPGECLHITDEELGLDITAIILRRQIDPATMKVTFEMITETAAKHAYCLGLTGVAPPTPAVGQTAQERDELAAAANGDATPQIVGPTSKVVEAKTNGDAVDGELPFTTSFSLLYRGTDRTTDAAWSVNVDSGTITLSIGAATGQVTVTAMDSLLASYTVTATIDGRETKFVHQVAKRLAGVDINTGTGGSSSADNSFNSFSSTSYVVVTDVMNMQTGTAGEVDLSAPLTIKVGSGSPTGSYSATLQWEQDIGGTWTAVGSAHVSGNTQREPDGTVIPASASANETLTGLTASTAYSFRLTAKANAGDGVTRFLSGTASATGS